MFRTKISPLRQQDNSNQQFTVLAPHYDELMRLVPYSAWVEYVQLLWRVADFEPRTILDCACGTGNVSFEFAGLGYDVTGVDISPGMIESARRKMQSTLAPVRSGPLAFHCADLVTFDLQSTFDGATCLYDSFNYILEPSRLQSAFARIAAHIKTGGVFVFDMNTPWAFEANLFTQRNRDPSKSLHYDWRSSYGVDSKICEVEMLFERRSKTGQLETFSEMHRERAYTQAEVTSMLVQTGWQLLKVYDAYTLNPPRDRSERWYFVARRVPH